MRPFIIKAVFFSCASVVLAENLGDSYSPSVVRTSEKVVEVIEKYRVEIVNKKISVDVDRPSQINLNQASAAETYIYYLQSYLVDPEDPDLSLLKASNRLEKEARDRNLSREQRLIQQKNFRSLVDNSVVGISHEYHVRDLGLVFLRQTITSKKAGNSTPFSFFIPRLILIDGEYFIDDLKDSSKERELVKVLREEFPFNSRVYDVTQF